MDAWLGQNENLKAETLEREFESSMQAIMAAAIAVDAFYAAIKPKIQIPEDLREQWRQNRTPRYAQIAEVVRRGFSLPQNGAKNLRQNLKEIFRLRDLAVHPSGNIEAPIPHPELTVGVEWRFAWFRFDNAIAVVRATLDMLQQLAKVTLTGNDVLVRYKDALWFRLEPIIALWQQEFGPLINSGSKQAEPVGWGDEGTPT